MCIIAVIGAPHSGKTVFINSLYRFLRQVNIRFFIHSACPDGEGRWCGETDQELVKKIRKKGKFDEHFVQYQLRVIENLRRSGFQLVFFDLGGLPSKENKQILEHCDYYIFLRRPDKQEVVQKWQELLDSLNIKPLAIFDSLWQGKPEFHIENNVVYGTLVRLDRAEVPENTLKVVGKFVEFLIEKFGGVSVSERFVVKVGETDEFVFVDIVVGGNGIIVPEELERLVKTVEQAVSNRYFGKGVIISGRLPIWAHSTLAHQFHTAKFVAHFDPRLGAVVVQSHSPDYKVGQVIPLEQIEPLL